MERLGRVTPATAQVLEVLLSADSVWGLQIVKETGKKPGTIYPIMERLESAGWIAGEWDADEGRKGPRRRYYRLTAEARPLAVGYVKAQLAKSIKPVTSPGSPAISRISWSGT